ncbi:amino acid ABC transporter permease [Thalassobaculum sp. OXR-137]|uniref:amino acid ABC transporter permease n=1 Tax=Thalassobaculum sp. OXR-137 TaxID=3100173 RepID=UPI002AC8FE93|nr:amino acid ABC transporter permease [Thalassobaculum sp. OXR-137]WPZ33075.1 amino acid ABC transporter permease [Thalassobaculum sp. OXR-137]
MTDATQSDTAFRPKPSLPPPPNTVGVIGWLRKNLFGGPVDAILTLLGIYVVYLILQFAVEYGILNAVWTADTYRECLDINKGEGACWAGIGAWFNGMMYGRYPDEEQWRVNLGGIILLLWLIPFWLPKVTGKIQVGMSAVLTFPFLGSALFIGGDLGIFLHVMAAIALTLFVSVWLHVTLCYVAGKSLPQTLVSVTGFADKDDRLHKYVLMGAFGIGFVLAMIYIGTWELQEVPTTIWGGLFLTLVISGIGIASALPNGILLALGRRSKMPVIRVFCTAFIELFRSVPLITILFMAVTMMPLFLPVEINPPKLAMVIVAVCIFAAAYMAETVRGGLQAVSKGQYEAAQAMGLSFWKMMALIVMPQALKLMIPNIVGSFMGLMKDTTLVSIIGLYDILLMGKAAGQNPSWLGFHTEPLLFTAAIFFVLCFAMSKYSQHLERTIGGGYGRR